MEESSGSTVRSEETARNFSASFRIVALQFGLLLWKNVILQIRRPFGTLVEIVLPLLAAALLIVLRFGLVSEERCFLTYESDTLTIPTLEPYTVYYAPNTSAEVNKLATDYIAPLLAPSRGSIVGLPTADDFVTYVSNTSRSAGCFLGGAGIYFTDVTGDNVQFSIRLRPDTFLHNTWFTERIRADVISFVGTPFLFFGGSRWLPSSYKSEGFVQLQKIVSEAIIEYKTGQKVDVNVEIRQFPYPRSGPDEYLIWGNICFAIIISISIMYSIGTFIQELTLEKESRVKETMKIMGLQNWALWMSWFLKEFVLLMFVLALVGIMLKFGQVLPYSDYSLMLLFFVLMVTSSIAFSFFLSSLFSSATTGLVVGIVIWFFCALIHLILGALYDDTHFAVKLIASFVPVICSGYGLQIMQRLDSYELGLNYDTFFEPLVAGDLFNMGWVFLILFIDSFVYMALYWYIDAVFPGNYGVPKPYYFFLLPSYWTGKTRHKLLEENVEEIEMSTITNSKNHETEPTTLKIGISIKNLRKVFNPKSESQRKVALNGVNMNIYEGQITALLGHNGAGKTTTMSILTGLFPSTSGSAYINGLSVVDDIDLIRRNLGICPQHNVLFDRLTVAEHLNFFAKLKGATGNIREEIEDLIDDLELDDKENVQSQNLSGGMKRKLSVAIALVGGSKYIILDEPSSGMDPYARRITWNLLIKYKQERTIILTTQFMDEADVLGDRIAIMKNGQIKTSGSSFFLKKRYGVGYHLTIEKHKPDIDTEDAIKVVLDNVQGSKVLSEIGTELTILLPDKNSHQFPKMLDTLEAKKENLGIDCIGISVATLEEVFLEIGRGTDETIEAKIERKASQHQLHPSLESMSLEPLPESTQTTKDENDANHSATVAEKETYNTGFTLYLQQLYSMLVKRYYYIIRSPLIVILSIAIPVLTVLSALLFAFINSDNSEGSLQLKLPDLALGDNNTFFWAEFGSNFSIKFGAENASLIAATEFFNYTSDIEAIRSSVNNITNVSSCCNYQHQFLDKYCVSRTFAELDGVCTNSNFGYSLCPACLSCCEFLKQRALTCTIPSSEFNLADSALCPIPPSLTLSERFSGNTLTGPLDDISVYVAEKILQDSSALRPKVYDLRVVAGFVFDSEPKATYATCGSEDISETCQYLAPALLSSQTTLQQFIATTSNINTTTLINDLCPSFNPSSLSCELLQSTAWNYNFAGILDSCMYESSCTVSNPQCQSNVSFDCQFGRTSTPLNTDTSSSPTVTVWYNNQGFHTLPIALNSFYNLYIRGLNSSYSLSISNHPLPRSSSNSIGTQIISPQGLFIGIIISLGFSFSFAFVLIIPLRERQEKSKHLQLICGVKGLLYWLANYIIDGCMFLVVIVLCLILFAAIQVTGLSGANLGLVFLILVLASWSLISLSYVLSFVFANAFVGFLAVFIFYSFVALGFHVSSYALELNNVDEGVRNVLHYIFSLHSVYSFTSAFSNMYGNQLLVDSCTASTLACNFQYTNNIWEFSLPGVGHTLLYLTIQGLVATTLVILLEYGFFAQKFKSALPRKYKTVPQAVVHDDIIDEKILEETKAATSVTDFNHYPVVVQNIVKNYKSISAELFPCCSVGSTKLAVDNISLLINKGECFGLLGVNGAGKTTLFKMLTGDISVTSGNAYIAGYNLLTQIRSAQQHIGYCPQFNALINIMTGRELLIMFARLRGIKEKYIPSEVDKEIKRMNLVDYANKRCGNYSGGNKRKLSTAISFVGSPSIVFLDEPTSGMDPVTRRFVWNAIIDIVKEGHSIILTSHSMEECEALCTRLAIMVNGNFKALGSIQHLKSKQASTYILQVKVTADRPRRPTRRESRRSNTDERGTESRVRQIIRRVTNISTSSNDDTSSGPVSLVRRVTQKISLRRSTSSSNADDDVNQIFVEKCKNITSVIKHLFPGAKEIDKYLGSITYELPSDNKSYQIFNQIEGIKHKLHISEYSVTQPSLEKIFLNFASKQND